MSELKISSKDFFSKLSAENIGLADEFYDEKVVFRDPLGELKGIEAIKKYYGGL
jgi:hypothetical protein